MNFFKTNPSWKKTLVSKEKVMLICPTYMIYEANMFKKLEPKFYGIFPKALFRLSYETCFCLHWIHELKLQYKSFIRDYSSTIHHHPLQKCKQVDEINRISVKWKTMDMKKVLTVWMRFSASCLACWSPTNNVCLENTTHHEHYH